MNQATGHPNQVPARVGGSIRPTISVATRGFTDQQQRAWASEWRGHPHHLIRRAETAGRQDSEKCSEPGL